MDYDLRNFYKAQECFFKTLKNTKKLKTSFKNSK